MITLTPTRVQPEAGIYEGLPEDTYRNGEGWRDRMSVSTLCNGTTSMLKLKAAMDGLLDSDSDDKKFGRDYHSRILTPRLFFDTYAVMPEFEPTDKSKEWKNFKASTDYKDQRDEWLKDQDGIQIIQQKNMDHINAMAEVLYAHPVVEMLRAKGGHEVSIQWEPMGVPFRSRVDKYIPGTSDMPPTIIDLKKTADLDNYALDRDCRKFNYHIKGYAYYEAVRQVTGEQADFIWIFQQDKPPYDVRVRQFDSSSFDIAKFEFQNLLHRYKICRDNDHWPGVSDDIEQRCLPEWYIKQAERAVNPL